MVPKVAGVSDLQRRGKAVLDPIKEDKDNLVLLSDRNHVFGVIMNVDRYEELLKLAMHQENDFWLSAAESSLDFWKHSSNNAYEKLL